MMLGRLSILIYISALIGISGGCHSSAQNASISGDNTAAAREFVQCMIDGRFANATTHFDSVMSQAMSAAQLEQAWKALISQCGAIKRIGETRTAKEGLLDIVFVVCEFEKTTLDTKIVFDRDSKIGGLWFVPHIAAAEAQYSPPVYAQDDRFAEQEVTVGSGEWKLPGTLSMPKGKGPFPAVALVHGSGPNDKDETIGPNKPFRDLAWGLASQGIAVLRYDKRTKVYGDKMAKSTKKLTVKEEVIDDALAAVKALRDSERVDSKKIFVLGHSLGGMLIPRIGKADPNIAGLIVMAGPTRLLEDVFLDQVIYLASLNGSPSLEVKKQIDLVRRQVANVKSPKLAHSAPVSSLPMGVPATYWLDLRGYHPAETAKSLKQPMLIVQAGRDYQVTNVDYEGWVKALSARQNVTFKLYPNLNHLFMEGEGKSVPQEYEKRSPVSKSVIDDLVAWVNAH